MSTVLYKYLYSCGMDSDDNFVSLCVMFANFSTNFTTIVRYETLLSCYEFNSQHRLETRTYEIGFEEFGSCATQVSLPGVESYGVPRIRREVDAIVVLHKIGRSLDRLDDAGIILPVFSRSTNPSPDNRTLRQALTRRHDEINKTRKN